MFRRANFALTHMWNGPVSKVFPRESPSYGAVICPACMCKRMRFAGVSIVTLSEGEVSELHIGLKGTMSTLYLKDLAGMPSRRSPPVTQAPNVRHCSTTMPAGCIDCRRAAGN